jgi:hypothetical protein
MTTLRLWWIGGLQTRKNLEFPAGAGAEITPLSPNPGNLG